MSKEKANHSAISREIRQRCMMTVFSPSKDSEALQAERLEQHLKQVSNIRQRLFELDRQIESGIYTVETLNEFSDVYSEYLEIRTTNSITGHPSFLRRLANFKK